MVLASRKLEKELGIIYLFSLCWIRTGSRYLLDEISSILNRKNIPNCKQHSQCQLLDIGLCHKCDGSSIYIMSVLCACGTSERILLILINYFNLYMINKVKLCKKQ